MTASASQHPHRVASPRAFIASPARLFLAALLGSCVAALSACGNTLQDEPIASSTLEALVTINEYPIYWVGTAFEKLAVTNVLRDPSGAFSVQYGDCVEGGQNTCVPPLAVVTTPDNSFHPVGLASHTALSIRGVRAALVQGGGTIEIETAGVVVDIYAKRAALARAAAQTMVAINQGGLPGAPLPSPLPDTGVNSRPLEGQLPHLITRTVG